MKSKQELKQEQLKKTNKEHTHRLGLVLEEGNSAKDSKDLLTEDLERFIAQKSSTKNSEGLNKSLESLKKIYSYINGTQVDELVIKDHGPSYVTYKDKNNEKSPLIINFNLFTGGENPDHAIYAAIYEDRIIITNRGYGANENTVGSRIYHFKENPITEASKKTLIEKLKNFSRTKPAIYEHESPLLDKIISEYVATPPIHIPLGYQKYGTCSFANLKGLLFTMLCEDLNYSKAKPAEKEKIMKEAKSIYKEFTSYIRTSTIDKILTEIKSTETELQENLENNILVLAHYIISHHDINKQQEVALIKKIFESLNETQVKMLMVKLGSFTDLKQGKKQRLKLELPETLLVIKEILDQSTVPVSLDSMLSNYTQNIFKNLTPDEKNKQIKDLLKAKRYDFLRQILNENPSYVVGEESLVEESNNLIKAEKEMSTAQKKLTSTLEKMKNACEEKSLNYSEIRSAIDEFQSKETYKEFEEKSNSAEKARDELKKINNLLRPGKPHRNLEICAGNMEIYKKKVEATRRSVSYSLSVTADELLKQASLAENEKNFLKNFLSDYAENIFKSLTSYDQDTQIKDLLKAKRYDFLKQILNANPSYKVKAESLQEAINQGNMEIIRLFMRHNPEVNGWVMDSMSKNSTLDHEIIKELFYKADPKEQDIFLANKCNMLSKAMKEIEAATETLSSILKEKCKTDIGLETAIDKFSSAETYNEFKEKLNSAKKAISESIKIKEMIEFEKDTQETSKILKVFMGNLEIYSESLPRHEQSIKEKIDQVGKSLYFAVTKNNDTIKQKEAVQKFLSDYSGGKFSQLLEDNKAEAAEKAAKEQAAEEAAKVAAEAKRKREAEAERKAEKEARFKLGAKESAAFKKLTEEVNQLKTAIANREQIESLKKAEEKQRSELNTAESNEFKVLGIEDLEIKQIKEREQINQKEEEGRNKILADLLSAKAAEEAERKAAARVAAEALQAIEKEEQVGREALRTAEQEGRKALGTEEQTRQAVVAAEAERKAAEEAAAEVERKAAEEAAIKIQKVFRGFLARAAAKAERKASEEAERKAAEKDSKDHARLSLELIFTITNLPEPVTPEPEPVTPEPEPVTPEPEPVTPEPELVTPEPEPVTSEPVTPEPVTPKLEQVTPKLEPVTPKTIIPKPEPEAVTPKPNPTPVTPIGGKYANRLEKIEAQIDSNIHLASLKVIAQLKEDKKINSIKEYTSVLDTLSSKIKINTTQAVNFEEYKNSFFDSYKELNDEEQAKYVNATYTYIKENQLLGKTETITSGPVTTEVKESSINRDAREGLICTDKITSNNTSNQATLVQRRISCRDIKLTNEMKVAVVGLIEQALNNKNLNFFTAQGLFNEKQDENQLKQAIELGFYIKDACEAAGLKLKLQIPDLTNKAIDKDIKDKIENLSKVIKEHNQNLTNKLPEPKADLKDRQLKT